MCMFCAATVGAKLNADQLHKEEARRLPIPKITVVMIGSLATGPVIYRTLTWES